MFRNYILSALRNIARHRLYSFINIAGLAVGLTCAILIMLFVRDEMSYDKWIPGSDKLWRFEVTYHVPGRSDAIDTAQSPMPIPVAMRDQIPEVTGMARLVREGMTLTAGDRQFPERVGTVDPNFLQVVRLPLVSGDPRTVLSRPENIVISQSAARKYFGNADPMGKTLTTGRGGCSDPACANQMVVLRVAGVMRDLPHNTQLIGDLFLPNTSVADRTAKDMKKDSFSQNGWSYVSLAPGVDPHTHAKISTGQADTKFGFNIADGSAEKALRRCLELDLNVIGFHCHVGSQLLDPEAQRAGGEFLAAFATEMKEKLGYEASYINIGGGLGVRYVDGDSPMDVRDYNRLIANAIGGLDVVVGQEPGRSQCHRRK